MSKPFKWIVGLSVVGILVSVVILLMPEKRSTDYPPRPTSPFEQAIYDENRKLDSVTLVKSAHASVGHQSFKKTTNFPCHGVVPVSGRPKLKFKLIYQGKVALTDLAVAPADRERMYFLEQNTGKIRVLRHGKLMEQPFLDVHKKLSLYGEKGLLGMAFHPNYRLNRKFYIYITASNGDVRILEYRTSANPEIADPKSERTILVVPQPEGNHNGGGLRFGPDGFLYVAIGDGGGGGDRHGKIGNSQDPSNLLGTIARIDVNKRDGKLAYAIPADNPYRKTKGFRPEIAYWGLRNPWRISFDHVTGDLWIGDVGQNRAEEINFAPKGKFGLNFGWRCKEGILKFANDKHCATTKKVDPVIHLRQYKSGSPRYCSVMPGYHYRGCKMPGYRDTFFYTDYCIQQVRGVRWDGKKPSKDKLYIKTPPIRVTSWAEDHQGELYVTTGTGLILKMVPQ